MANDDNDNAADHGMRREARHVVEVAGRYRSRIGVSRDIWIKDISETGCRFFDKFSVLEVGSTVLFRVGEIGPISAHIRWRDKNTVGVEFERPLHPSVLDHIIKTMDQLDQEPD